MNALLDAINTCSVYELYGFRGNFCTWQWSWTIDTNEAVLFQLFLWLVYAVSVKLVQLYVGAQGKPYKPPRWLDSAKYIHNIALSLVSFWMFAVIIYKTAVEDGRFNSWHDMSCRMTPMTSWYGFAQFIFLVSKIWEWVDTYFLVLSGKKVIWLHWFHHMTTFTMAAVTHNFPSGGFTWINCIIHFVMYLHYASPQRWARPFITSSQLTQFVIVMTIHTYGLLNPVTCYDMTGVMREWWYCIGVVAIYFVMFSAFFIEEYVSNSNKKKAAKKIA